MDKPLFITIDTEGDNLWARPDPRKITTENAIYIPRFQELCEEYGLIPIWLINYEMIHDKRVCSYLKPKAHSGLCRVGMHLHAINTPPLYQIEGFENSTGAFITDYPDEIIYKKTKKLKDDIESIMEIKVNIHRSGRWMIDDRYARILQEVGIKYDCTITPGIDWSNASGINSNTKGANYHHYKNDIQQLVIKKKYDIVEYPVTILDRNKVYKYYNKSMLNSAKAVYHYVVNKKIWLRPNKYGNTDEMLGVLMNVMFGNLHYAEFMIHSSELMSKGSPSFTSEEDIENMYMSLNKIFSYARSIGFIGGVFDD